jgi:putative transposase
MPRYKIHDQKGLQFITLTVVGWISVFNRLAYRNILIDSLNYCRIHKGLHIFAYVVMSNHLHLVVQVREESTYTLSEILRDFKKYTSRIIMDQIEQPKEPRGEWMLYLFRYFGKFKSNIPDRQLWMHGNHPIHLYSPKVIWQKVNYIHQNPVKAGIVDTPEAYLYSSARNYATDNREGIMAVDLLEPWLPGGYWFVPR